MFVLFQYLGSSFIALPVGNWKGATPLATLGWQPLPRRFWIQPMILGVTDETVVFSTHIYVWTSRPAVRRGKKFEYPLVVST